MDSIALFVDEIMQGMLKRGWKGMPRSKVTRSGAATESAYLQPAVPGTFAGTLIRVVGMGGIRAL